MFSSKYCIVDSHLCYSVSNWTNGVQVCFTLAILRLLYAIFYCLKSFELLGIYSCYVMLTWPFWQ